MNYIVFDLEWNMGYCPHVFSYQGAEIALRGEIIQIGAVRIDAQGGVLDSFHATLKPRIFRRLHHQITKVTGLTQQALQAGTPIRAGLEHFISWCGADAALFTWGPDDIGVLKQNLFLNALPVLDWPPAYFDLQRIYTTQRPRAEGEGMTLEAVTERLGIPLDGTFHDALSDARYTAAICTYLDLERGAAEYEDIDTLLLHALLPAPANTIVQASANAKEAAGDPEMPKPPTPPIPVADAADFSDFQRLGPTPNRDAWDGAAFPAAVCPLCGVCLALDTDHVFLKKGNHGRNMLCTCPVHGAFLTHWKRMQQDGLHWHFARVVQRLSPEAATQWQKKKAVYLAALRRRQQAALAAAQAAAQQPGEVKTNL